MGHVVELVATRWSRLPKISCRLALFYQNIIVDRLAPAQAEP